MEIRVLHLGYRKIGGLVDCNQNYESYYTFGKF